MDIKERFGRATQKCRQSLNITQEDLALRIDADQAYISRIEAGEMNVTLETAQHIAEALGVDIVRLFDAQ